MARNGLTDRMVKQVRKPGVLIDGAGLRLRITANANTGELRKSWVLRVTVKGGPVREIGLGSAHDIPLAEARERATEARKLARDGVDPVEARDAEVARRALETARAMTFRQCAEALIASHEAGWKNAKHRQQWANTLKTYAYPVFGGLPVQAVDVSLVMKAIEPIWKTKTETASRVRQRIESVLDWAAVRGYRQGENPARWRGHLERALPARAKVQKVNHHAALPFADLPAFMGELRAMSGDSARALEFAILTATRTNETLKARWSEIDLKAKVWTVPGERMKAGREHRVPLPAAAVAVLETMRKAHPKSDWVFPGASPRTDREPTLSSMALLMTLRRMKRTDLTAHGFRSTFRDWAGELTNFPREVAEQALAHSLKDKTEAAYRRGDALEKRRLLMDAWGAYCTTSATERGAVVALRRAAETA
ncbi:MAG: tyrosine-type recombinase/integrase [Terricaulis sp.]